MADIDSNRVTPNWRPWPLSLTFLSFIVFLAFVLAASLEAVVRLSNKTVSTESLLQTWESWFFNTSVPAKSGAGSVLLDATRVDVLANGTSCKQGLLHSRTSTQLSKIDYFAWFYFPTIICILYGLLWDLIDNTAKRCEPFHQASRPGGAMACTTICADYASVPAFLSPLQAIARGEHLILISSIAWMMATIVAPAIQTQLFKRQIWYVQLGHTLQNGTFLPFTHASPIHDVRERLQSAMVQIVCTGESEAGDSTVAEPAGALQTGFYVEPSLGRAQMAVYLSIAILAAGALYSFTRRRSGLLRDHFGIASLASLAYRKGDISFLKHFWAIQEDDTEEVMQRKLEEKRVSLSWLHGRYGFGFVEDTQYSRGSHCPWMRRIVQVTYKHYEQWLERHASPWLGQLLLWKYSSHHSLSFVFQRCLGLMLIPLGWLGITLVSIVVNIKGDLPDVERLPVIDKGYGGNFVYVVVLTVCIKTIWQTVDAQFRCISLYLALNKGPLRLWPQFERNYTTTPPIYIVAEACQDQQWILASITLWSTILEIMVICAGSLAAMSQGDGLTRAAFYWNTGIVFSILASTIAFLILLGRFLGPRCPKVPRSPTTLAATMSYICHSTSFLEHIEHGFLLERKERRQYLARSSMLFRYGYFKPSGSPGASGLDHDDNDRSCVLGIEENSRVERLCFFQPVREMYGRAR